MTERIEEMEIRPGLWLVCQHPAGEYVVSDGERQTEPLHHEVVAQIRGGKAADWNFDLDWPVESD